MEQPTVNNSLNPFSATLNKIKPEIAAPAADATPESIEAAQVAADSAAPPVSPTLLDNNTPVAAEETPAEVTPTEVAPDETPAPDTFFSDPLKNKPAEVDQTTEALELANEYKAMQSDPDFQLFREYKKAGKSLSDLTNDFKHVDYNKMDNEALVKSYGAFKGYTPDETEEALTELNGLGKLSRDREIEAMKQTLENHQNGQRQKLAGDARQQAEAQNRVRTQYASEADQIGSEMIGKDYNGVKLDQEKQKDWMQFASTFTLMRQDGTLATEEIFKIWLHKLIPQIQSTAASKSHHQGREEILKEVVRPIKEATNGKLPITAGTGEVKHDPKALTKQITQSPSQRGA